MSLELGSVAFPPDHRPYESAEQRRRRRRRDWETSHRTHGVVPGGEGATLPEGEVPSHIAELSISPDTFAPKDVAFRLGATQDRMGRSFVAAFASHGLAFGFLALLISLAPERVLEIIEPNREDYGIVWIPEEGPGGGGGGGGNESLELPRPVQIEGPDESELSVPVEVEPDFVEPEVEPETSDVPEMNIPAMTMASALESLPGVMDHIDAANDSLSQGSGTGGGGGTGTGSGVGPGEGAGLGPGTGGGTGGGVYRPGAGIQNPRVLREVKPQYTSEAMRAQVQGEVWLEVVVLEDGTVGDVRVTKSLDPVFGLDEEAIKAARQWRFTPALRFGEPVPILIGIALEFHLR